MSAEAPGPCWPAVRDHIDPLAAWLVWTGDAEAPDDEMVLLCYEGDADYVIYTVDPDGEMVDRSAPRYFPDDAEAVATISQEMARRCFFIEMHRGALLLDDFLKRVTAVRIVWPQSAVALDNYHEAVLRDLAFFASEVWEAVRRWWATFNSDSTKEAPQVRRELLLRLKAAVEHALRPTP